MIGTTPYGQQVDVTDKTQPVSIPPQKPQQQLGPSQIAELLRKIAAARRGY